MYRVFPLMLLLALLASCGDQAVRVQATIPAQRIDLASQGVKRIAIGDLKESGDDAPAGAGQAVGDDLRASLVGLNRFEVLDRSAVADLLKEHQFNDSGLVDSTQTVVTGKLSGATVLIIGNLTSYHVHSQMTTANGANAQTFFRRVATGVIDVSLRIVDLTTGRLIAAVPCHAELTVANPPDVETAQTNMFTGQQSTMTQQQWSPQPLGEVDASLVMDQLRKKVATEFVSAISPTQVEYDVQLQTDDKVPELDQGSREARIGEWENAIVQFKLATAKAPQSPAAYYDLGIALRATGDYAQALSSLEAAFRLKDDPLYETEINRTKTFAQGAAQK